MIRGMIVLAGAMTASVGAVIAVAVPATVRAPLRGPNGYLAAAARPDLTHILPGPPRTGSAGAQADAKMFIDTRTLTGSARWRQAQADVSDDLVARFEDAIGFTIDLQRAPVFATLMARFGVDRSAAVSAAKRNWQAPRPFVGNDLPICEPRTDGLVANGDYPSGHSANGMAFALILSELLPDRATALLARGRDYADSRRICGSHSASAVEGGLLAAAAIVAAAHGSAAFRHDMASARQELQAMRGSLTRRINPKPPYDTLRRPRV